MCAACLWTAFGTAAAQIPTDLSELTPVQWGKLQIFPAVETGLSWTDNLFSQATNPVTTAIFSATPSFLAQVPFGRSAAQLGYSVVGKKYSTVQSENQLTHYVLGDTRLLFGSGLAVQLRDEYRSGVIDVEAIDPGGELRFRGDRFESNDVDIAFGVPHGDLLAFGASVGSSRIRFKSQGYRDVDAISFQLGGEHRASPTLRLGWQISRDDADLRPSAGGVDDEWHQTEDFAGVIGDWQIGPGSSFPFEVSLTRVRSENLDRPEFSTRASGLTGSLSYRQAVPARTALVVSVERDVYTSVYQNNAFYVSNRASAEFKNDPEARLALGTRLAYTINAYPEEDDTGIQRRDETTDWEVWAGLPLPSGFELRVWGRYGLRTSRQESLGYEATSVGVSVRLGQ